MAEVTEILDPEVAVRAWAEGFAPVQTQPIDLDHAAGLVLAQPIVADRDSPAHDVSAMDGYAVRLDDFDDAGRLPVAGEVETGSAPPNLPKGHARRIFTGGCVPQETQLVIKREDLAETRELIELNIPIESLKPGQHIRRKGENATQGDTIVSPGVAVSPAVIAAAASFGATTLCLHRPLRVGLLITGDELLAPEDTPQPWQIRDSNGPAIEALLQTAPWIHVAARMHAIDDPQQLAERLGDLLEQCDAVITTGGVSMGDHDYIPAVIQSLGGSINFHKLPIRPGKPMLGATGPQGQAILGLPGNPVSAMLTLQRFGQRALRQRAGFAQTMPTPATVQLTNTLAKPVALWSYRLVRLTQAGQGELVATRGSGDLASVARSDGTVQLPPGTMGDGPLAFYPWSLR